MSDPAASAAETGPPIVVGKEELLDILQRILAFSREYGELLETASDTDVWREKALALFTSHHERLSRDGSPLEKLGMVLSLVHFLLQRVNQDRFQFKLSSRVGTFPEQENSDLMNLSNHLREWTQPVSAMMADVMTLGTDGSTVQRDNLRTLLAGITSFFKGVVRQDWDDVSLVMSYINLVTSTRERNQLVHQIAKLAREIYDSLNQFSEEIDFQSLSTTTGEIPDAVVKLRSVIDRLGEAANTNLDTLERLSEESRENCQWVAESLQVAIECDGELEQLASSYPEIAEQCDEARNLLRVEVKTHLDALAAGTDADGQNLLTMISNQSFQDLTGQTLTKVINFIESLQLQLVGLLKRYTDATGAAAAAPAPEASTEPVEKRPPTQSQEQVDQLLSELGF